MPSGYSSFRNTFPLVAGGNISPSTIIALSTTANQTAIQASSTVTVTVGIVGEGTQDAPLTGYSGYHAVAGGPIGDWFAAPADGLLVIGTGGCTAGDCLTTDGNGNGVTTTTSGAFVSAQALETCVATEKCHVVGCKFFYV
jgi:hypothetical protein